MRQNMLTGEKRYLDNAIAAQHGEFPSRLLDVSYLHTLQLVSRRDSVPLTLPDYEEETTDFLDDKDGMVYLFFIDEIFSPSAQNTNDNYNAIINRNVGWYLDNALFWNNHKFIDHAKLNNRIIAQQGAFILFPGEEPEGLPDYMYCGIRISKTAKALIRQELKLLFGIHTGSIYPEIINLVKEISGISKKLNTENFTCLKEMEYTLRQMEKELVYYLDYAIEHRKSDNIDQILIYIERKVNHYRKVFLEFIQ